MIYPGVSTSDLNTIAVTQLIDTQTAYEFIGTALSIQTRIDEPNGHPLTVVSYSKANPGIVTVTAHGLLSDNKVTIAGATAGWITANGDHVITVTDADTFTIALDTTGFAGSFDGVIYTRAPRTGDKIWSIKKIYNTAGVITRISWAQGNSDYNKIWDNRGTYDYS